MLLSINDVLQKKISHQRYLWSTCEDITVKEALVAIKGDNYKRPIQQLREIYKIDPEQYSIKKRLLPAVTFGGTFNRKRQKDTLENYTNLMVLDVDKIDGEEMQRTKHVFHQDEHVFAYWESPSQQGIKGLVLLDFCFAEKNEETDHVHKMAFEQLYSHFQEKHCVKLDRSGSDYTRLCFYSWDPALLIKKSIRPFKVEKRTIKQKRNGHFPLPNRKTSRDALYNPFCKNLPKNKQCIKQIIKFLKKTNASITYEYEDWIRIAFAIANSFTFDLGEKYFLELSAMDQEKFDKLECQNLLMHCYQTTRGSISFGSIIYLAQKAGFIHVLSTKEGS